MLLFVINVSFVKYSMPLLLLTKRNLKFIPFLLRLQDFDQHKPF